MAKAGKDIATATEGKAVPAHSIIDDAFSALQVINVAVVWLGCTGVEENAFCEGWFRNLSV